MKSGNQILFSKPDGGTLLSAVPLSGLSELGETEQHFEDSLAGYGINKDTCLPNYGGDGMDYDLALHALAPFA